MMKINIYLNYPFINSKRGSIINEFIIVAVSKYRAYGTDCKVCNDRSLGVLLYKKHNTICLSLLNLFRKYMLSIINLRRKLPWRIHEFWKCTSKNSKGLKGWWFNSILRQHIGPSPSWLRHETLTPASHVRVVLALP